MCESSPHGGLSLIQGAKWTNPLPAVCLTQSPELSRHLLLSEMFSIPALINPKPKSVPPLWCYTWETTRTHQLDTCSRHSPLNQLHFCGELKILSRTGNKWQRRKMALTESLIVEKHLDNYFRQETRRVAATNWLQSAPLPSNMLAVRCHLSPADMISGVIKDNEVEHRHRAVYLHALSPSPSASHSRWFTSLLNNMTFPQGHAGALMCRKFVHECTS